MLPACSYAFLAGGSAPVIALFGAQKHVFELIHPRVGEKQRGVVHRHQRRTPDDPVSVALEELQECASDFVAGHGE
jgi:hypothetical protein